MPDNLFEQSLRLGNLIHLLSSVLARLGFIREIVRFNLLPPHHPEEMFSMLVIILRFDRITAQDGCLSKCHIALVLSPRIRRDIATAASEWLG
jgi:hypothetical protein